MKIENPLLKGSDSESLKFQATMLQGYSNSLATESAASFARKVLDPFMNFVYLVRDSAVKKLSMIPSFGKFVYRPVYANLDRAAKLNFGVTRGYVIASIPHTDAKVKDYLGYLDMMTDVVNNVVNQTIPGCKEYFGMLLEDVTVLGSASASSAVDRLSTNKYAISQMNKKYPGVIKRNNTALARTTMAKQYDSMKDFIECQEYFKKISERAAGIKVEVASKEVNELNEIISRVIMVVKRKGDEVELDQNVVASISSYLYNLAEEIGMIAAFATYLDETNVALSSQLNDVVEMAGV